MAVGKSTVARVLAARWRVPCHDLDEVMGDVPALFSSLGEAGFREREHEVLRGLAGGEGVLALGGGALLAERNRRLLDGWRVVVLDARPETLALRLADGAGRPLAGRWRELYAERRPLYESLGPAVATDGISPAAVATAVEALLGELRAAPAGPTPRGPVSADPIRVPVNVEASPYEVVLADSFAGLGAELGRIFPVGRCALVTNDVVGPLHGAALEAEVASAGWAPTRITLPDGEDHKDVSTWSGCVDALLDARVDRKTPVLALGGGVTGDMVGFAAASVLRGVPFVQVPTTLLAMVDASVGGKTGVNTRQGKNLLGAFWQPRLVWAAQASLRTLPDDEMRCGLGEVVKHAILADEAALARCESLAPRLVAREPGALAQVVADSVRCKAAVVMADPRESGVRATLNLGHTMAHVIEAVAGYGRVRHGEAVALGLVAILRFSRHRGWLRDPGLVERVERLLAALGLPERIPPDLADDALIAAAGFDKKRTRGMLTLAVPVEVGNVDLRSLPMEEVGELVACLPR
jgi:3-dehydroquinate synthase